MVNKVILVGRLGKDPELRTTSGGKQTCRFSLATDSGFGDNKRTDWHSIVAWEKTAEACGRYLRKGSLVYVEGRLRYDKYEKDGQTRYTTDVIVNSIQFLSTKNEGGGGNFGGGGGNFADSPKSTPSETPMSDFGDDFDFDFDLPGL